MTEVPDWAYCGECGMSHLHRTQTCPTFEPKVNLPFPALPWESQVCQYPPFGPPGYSEFTPPAPYDSIRCLLWRDEMGALRGILNYYTKDIGDFEKAGNANIWVDPKCQGKGIGTALAREGMKRYGFDLTKQRFTPAGVRLAKKLLRG